MLRVTGTLTIEADDAEELAEKLAAMATNLFCAKVTVIDALHAEIEYHAEQKGAGRSTEPWGGKDAAAAEEPV